MKKLLVVIVLASGCAHYQGREHAHGAPDAYWCKRTVVSYAIGAGLTPDERTTIIAAADAWNVAANGRPMFERTDGSADIEISRNGGDWGTRLAIAPDGCIVHAHIEVGEEVEQTVTLRQSKHELGRALGLAESVWPGSVMYNGDEITSEEISVATRSCCQQAITTMGYGPQER